MVTLPGSANSGADAMTEVERRASKGRILFPLGVEFSGMEPYLPIPEFLQFGSLLHLKAGLSR